MKPSNHCVLFFYLIWLLIGNACEQKKQLTSPSIPVPPFYSNQYAQKRQQWEPFFWTFSKQQKISLQTGIQLSSYSFIHPYQPQLPVVLFIHGWTECAAKYAETIYDLYQQGFNVIAWDHRGHGFSTGSIETYSQCQDRQKQRCQTIGDPKQCLQQSPWGNCYSDLVDVERFEDYVTDMKVIFDQLIVPLQASKTLLVAHSMGGAIAALFLQRYPTLIDKAVLSSPMLAVKTHHIPALFVEGLTGFISLLGYAKKPEPFYKPFNPHQSFADNIVTSDLNRFFYSHELYLQHPTMAKSGTTYGWVHQALQATRQLRINDNKIVTPLLIFRAGLDQYVHPGVEEKLCQRAQKFCQVKDFPLAHHEILMEQDAIRDQALTLIFHFFAP